MWLHDGRIGDGTRDPGVPKSCNTIVVDQDVSLDRMDIGVCLRLIASSMLTGLILVCTMFNECRYLRPLVACASYQGRGLEWLVCEDYGDRLPVVIGQRPASSGCTRGCFRLATRD